MPFVNSQSSQISKEWASTLPEHFKPYSDLLSKSYWLNKMTHKIIEPSIELSTLGINLAKTLTALGMDAQTVAASLIYPAFQYEQIHIDDIKEHLSNEIASLLIDVKKMDTVDEILLVKYPNHKQLENLRKMIIAMVDDIRVVILKITEQLEILKLLSLQSLPIAKPIAQRVIDIYVPLTNRLGIGQLKWQLEDEAFRCLHPNDYYSITTALQATKSERDNFLTEITSSLQQELIKHPVPIESISGRSKHIYGIYKKMMQKQVGIAHIYDATAVRIITKDVAHCYILLSLVHNLWPNIPEEFDDYIVKPKNNGYQSLHTAVIGPHKRVFEVQIRTSQMHEQAELGLAAHWLYKEKNHEKMYVQQKQRWLKQVLAWRQTLSPLQQQTTQVDDRVYVFTPDWEVLDLPTGATPVDFAYHIHSEVGHHCRGAKCHGKMVPLTYQLKTGDQIEILTHKDATPSRDWLNPYAYYIKTNRARIKILHWFHQQEQSRHIDLGKEILDKELKKHHLKAIDLESLAPKYNLKSSEDLLAALGRGDIKITSLIESKQPLPLTQSTTRSSLPNPKETIELSGIGSVLTHFAKCCNPSPFDPIVGYVSQGRGVYIHRENCNNIKRKNATQKQRIIEVSWGQSDARKLIKHITILAFYRSNLESDIVSLLLSHSQMLSFQNQIAEDKCTARIETTIQIENEKKFTKLITILKQVKNVGQIQWS